MAGNEVFQNGEAFPEVCLNGHFKRFTGGVRNQAAHTSQLTDLTLVTPCTRDGHHVDRVKAVKVGQHILCNCLFCFSPNGAHPLVAFLRCEQSAAELGFNHFNLFFCLPDFISLTGGHNNVRNRNGGTRLGTVLKAKLHYSV